MVFATMAGVIAPTPILAGSNQRILQRVWQSSRGREAVSLVEPRLNKS